MSWQERAVVFGCQDDKLVGVMATPVDPIPNTQLGVLVVVGGPQYRAGAHRQFVQLARALAGAGHSVLRFDVRGMGDSEGDSRSFEALSDDVRAGIDALLAQAPDCRQLAVMGLCDGASAALLYLHDTGDSRVDGLCLLNPWLRSEESLARVTVKHYYLGRITSPDFWRKALSGGVRATALIDFLRTLVASRRTGAAKTPGLSKGRNGMDFRSAMLRACEQFQGPVLLGLSSDDLTAREFEGATTANPQWRAVLARARVQYLRLDAADHTLSATPARLQFEAAVLAWLGKLVAGRSAV